MNSKSADGYGDTITVITVITFKARAPLRQLTGSAAYVRNLLIETREAADGADLIRVDVYTDDERYTRQF